MSGLTRTHSVATASPTSASKVKVTGCHSKRLVNYPTRSSIFVQRLAEAAGPEG